MWMSSPCLAASAPSVPSDPRLEEGLPDDVNVVVVKREGVAVASTAPGASRKRKLDQAQDEAATAKTALKASKTEARK